MILDLFLLHVFHAPSYCSFTSNLTTCFAKSILKPKYRTSTLMLVPENKGCCSLGHCEQDCTAMNCKYCEQGCTAMNCKYCEQDCTAMNCKYCEQDCTAMNCKYFRCFSTILVCACVKISRWERIIIVIQHRAN
jgi:hypothetical protein